MGNKLAILQSNYIPWKGYFDLINEVDIFVFYDTVKYTKNDWRNRNIIYTKNGKQWLSIPIEASAVNLQINEVEIKNESWQELHFKSLYFGYKKAPYFYQLEEFLNDYLVEKKWDKLSQLNQYLIVEISKKMGITTQFKKAEDFNLTGDRIERLVSLINQNDASIYISGPSAKDYLNGNENLFKEANIELLYKSYPAYPTYEQLSKPFENSVSILDLIANVSWNNIPEYIWSNKLEK